MDEGPLDHLQQVEVACEAGIRWVQLRMKQADPQQFLDIAAAAKKICDEWGCALIINDRVEIAIEVKAHGVHLGKEDMHPTEARRLLGDDFIIGATANTMEDIRAHHRAGVDYVGLGPYRYTTTKKNLSPVLRLEGYRQIMDQLSREQISIPIIAIGGIGKEDAASLLHTGVQGIAFSGLLVHAADRKATVQLLKDEMQKIRHSGIV
jgi:thiamine-phosphate pyrophosphorylase